MTRLGLDSTSLDPPIVQDGEERNVTHDDHHHLLLTVLNRVDKRVAVAVVQREECPVVRDCKGWSAGSELDDTRSFGPTTHSASLLAINELVLFRFCALLILALALPATLPATLNRWGLEPAASCPNVWTAGDGEAVVTSEPGMLGDAAVRGVEGNSSRSRRLPSLTVESLFEARWLAALS